MAWSIQRVTSDGTLTEVSLSIKFLDTRDIRVKVNGVSLVEGTGYTWQGREKILFPAAIPNGQAVELFRVTDREQLRHIFQEGAPFVRGTLDDLNTQLLYLLQETAEGSGGGELWGQLDMHRYKIVNLEAGQNPRDAVNVSQVQELSERIEYIENLKGTNRRGPITISTLAPTGVPQQYAEWVMIGDVVNGAVYNGSTSN